VVEVERQGEGEGFAPRGIPRRVRGQRRQLAARADDRCGVGEEGKTGRRAPVPTGRGRGTTPGEIKDNWAEREEGARARPRGTERERERERESTAVVAERAAEEEEEEEAVSGYRRPPIDSPVRPLLPCDHLQERGRGILPLTRSLLSLFMIVFALRSYECDFGECLGHPIDNYVF
jgi:hypothetical protein